MSLYKLVSCKAPIDALQPLHIDTKQTKKGLVYVAKWAASGEKWATT